MHFLQELIDGKYRCNRIVVDPRQRGWPVARRHQHPVFIRQDCAPPVDSPALSLLLEATSQAGNAAFFVVNCLPMAQLSNNAQRVRDMYRARNGQPHPVMDLNQNPPLHNTCNGPPSLPCCLGALWALQVAFTFSMNLSNDMHETMD